MDVEQEATFAAGETDKKYVQKSFETKAENRKTKNCNTPASAGWVFVRLSELVECCFTMFVDNLCRLCHDFNLADHKAPLQDMTWTNWPQSLVSLQDLKSYHDELNELQFEVCQSNSPRRKRETAKKEEHV